MAAFTAGHAAAMDVFSSLVYYFQRYSGTLSIRVKDTIRLVFLSLCVWGWPDHRQTWPCCHLMEPVGTAALWVPSSCLLQIGEGTFHRDTGNVPCSMLFCFPFHFVFKLTSCICLPSPASQSWTCLSCLYFGFINIHLQTNSSKEWGFGPKGVNKLIAQESWCQLPYFSLAAPQFLFEQYFRNIFIPKNFISCQKSSLKLRT